MWLNEFSSLFAEATRLHFGKSDRAAELEAKLGAARQSGIIRREELLAIEDAGLWAYQRSWPSLSQTVGDSVEVGPRPRGLSQRNAWVRRSVRTVHGWLKHIEVTSIVLRYLSPQDFGIISPPLTSALLLPSRKSPVATYFDYLRCLEELRVYAGTATVAEVDQGLWAAQYLPDDAQETSQPALHIRVRRLTAAMNGDERFQLLRMQNLVSGLWEMQRSNTHMMRRLFAEAVDEHDRIISQVVLARLFEEGIKHLANREGIPLTDRDGRSVRLSVLRERLDTRGIRVGGTPVRDLNLRRTNRIRDCAVHASDPLPTDDLEQLDTVVRHLESHRRQPPIRP